VGQPSSGVVLGVVVFGLCSTGPIDAGARREDAIPLAVIVHDRAEVPAEALDQAMKQAASIYGQIGVAVEWRRDSGHEGAPAGNGRRTSPPAFSVWLILQDKLRATTARTEKFIMGAAVAPERECRGTVYLFNDQVEEFSRSRRVRYALVMGAVIAHETGHVLLRRKGHSPDGLMRAVLKAADWERAVMGLLWFAPGDAAVIRANASSCRS
jgi:hypothetical protein